MPSDAMKPRRTTEPNDILAVVLRDDVLPFVQADGMEFVTFKRSHFEPLVSNQDNYFFVGDGEHPRLVVFIRTGSNVYEVHVAFGKNDRGAEAIDFFRQSVDALFEDNPAAQVLIGRPNKGRCDVGVFATECGASHNDAGYFIVRKD